MNPADPARPDTAPPHDTFARGQECEASSVDDSTACPGGRAPPSDKHPPQPDAPRSHENVAEDTNIDPASPANSPANSESTSPPRPPSQQQQPGQYPALESHTRVYNSWSKDESTKLIELVQQYGTNRKWSQIAKHLPGRTGKQCRDRWNNHLRPGLKQGSWTPEEDYVVAYWHSCRGGSWAAIAFWLPGRTAVAIKNHWNAVSKLPDQGNKGTVLVTYTALLRTGLGREDAFDQAVAKVGMPRVRTAVLEQTLAAARVPPNTVVHPPRWDDILSQQQAGARGPGPGPLSAAHRAHLQDPELVASLARLRAHPHAAPHHLHDLPRSAAGGYHRSHAPLQLSSQYPGIFQQSLGHPKPPPSSRALHDTLTSPHPSAAHSLSTASFLDPSDLAPADPNTGRPLAHLAPPPRHSNPSIGSPDSICSVPSITEPHLAPLSPLTAPPPSPPATTFRSLPHHPASLFRGSHPPAYHPPGPNPHSPLRRSKPLSPFQLPAQTLPTEMPPSLLDPLAPPSLHPSGHARDPLQLARQQAAYHILLSRHADRLERQASAPTHAHHSTAAPPDQAPHGRAQLPRSMSLSLPPSQQHPSPSPQQHPHQSIPALASTDSQHLSSSSQLLPPPPDPHPTSWQTHPTSNLSPRHPLPAPDPPSLLPTSASDAPFYSDLAPAAHAPAAHTLAALEAEANFLEWAMSTRSYSSDASARTASSSAAAAANLEAAAAWASAGPTWRQHPLAGGDHAVQAGGGLGDLMDMDPRLEALLNRDELLQEYSAPPPLRDYAGAGFRDMAASGFPGSGGLPATSLGGGFPAGGLPSAPAGGAGATGINWGPLGAKRDLPEDSRAAYGAESEMLDGGGWRARAGSDMLRSKYMRLGYPQQQGGGGSGGGGAQGP